MYGVYSKFEVRSPFLLGKQLQHLHAHKATHPLAANMDIVGGLHVVKAFVHRMTHMRECLDRNRNRANQRQVSSTHSLSTTTSRTQRNVMLTVLLPNEGAEIVSNFGMSIHHHHHTLSLRMTSREPHSCS